jgi:hypothetical protein
MAYIGLDLSLLWHENSRNCADWRLPSDTPGFGRPVGRAFRLSIALNTANRMSLAEGVAAGDGSHVEAGVEPVHPLF